MSRVRFNGAVVATRNALRLHKYKNAAYQYHWNEEEDRVLPNHYKQKCEDFMRKEPEPVHYRPAESRWKLDESGKARVPNQNAPIHVIYPEECNQGLWGGEGLIFATYMTDWKWKKTWRHNPNTTLPKLWRPNLSRRIFYSEIMDKWYNIVVTLRTCDLVDNANGFDFYILKTHERDLNSKLGMKLKRDMLLALARKDLYPDDPVKREKIYNKYKDFIIPEKEAEWIGLPIEEAVKKGKEIDQQINAPIPMKYKLTKALVDRLKEVQEEEKEAEKAPKEKKWLKILSPFKDSSDEKKS